MNAVLIKELERIVRLSRKNLVHFTDEELGLVGNILTNGSSAVIVEMYCRERDNGIIRIKTDTVSIS